MPIRRSGACDQRRRRVLIEEKLHAGDADGQAPALEESDETPSTVRLPGRRYSGEASADRQQPLTAVIPKRAWTLLVLLLTGASVIAGIQAVYGQAGLQPPDHWLRAITALDVQSAGSLASWCSSIFLLAAAIQGLQIYRLRRHRADDYRGRYRVWIWVSPAMLAASLVVGTHLHRDVVTAISEHWEGLRAVRPHLAATIVPAVLWLLVALRLVFEVRESRASLAALLCATLSYSTAGMMFLLAADQRPQLPGIMMLSTLTMLGHLATMLMVASYSRFVYLDAQGLLVVRKKAPRKQRGQKPKRKRRAKGESAGDAPAVIPISEARVGQESEKRPAGVESSSTPGPRRGGTVSAEDQAPSSRSGKSTAADLSDASEAGLSKAERRRLKKMQRREQARKAA